MFYRYANAQMDRIEATNHIRTQMSEQPVLIALTANAREEDGEICMNAGMDDYISKPVELDKLVSKLEKGYDKISNFESEQVNS
ncbi:MAG: response regulator [Segetibacter sp.]|nr:response regulator [Segetibacter sp.]